MQLDTQHWHVAVVYPGHSRSDLDRPFEDIEDALEYADRALERRMGSDHTVTEMDRPDDDRAGVVQRHRAADGVGETIAVVEVRPCFERGCLQQPLPFRSRRRGGGRRSLRVASPRDSTSLAGLTFGSTRSD
jgi:hypothetical protein